MKIDAVVIGSGFSGSVIANLLATRDNKRVLVVEKSNHVGGNCYDYRDKNSIIIHKYGPHLFHTDYKDVVDFLEQFGELEPYQHRVLGFIDGKYLPLPFNLNSIYELFSPELARKLEKKLLKNFAYGARVPILELLESDDEDLKFLAEFVYEKVFLNYTMKQWGVKPDEIDKSVTARVPIVVSRDDRYFHDKYQFVPKEGYTQIIQNMLNHPNIKLMLQTNYHDICELKDDNFYLFGKKFDGKVIYTGGLDELFEYEFGELPYRSLNLVFQEKDVQFYQKASVVNYPNSYDFTRITEFKHIHPAHSNKSIILKEYPQEHKTDENIPYYPILVDENLKKYEKYKEKAKSIKNLIILGRLAEYRYYDMDDVIKKAFEMYKHKL